MNVGDEPAFEVSNAIKYKIRYVSAKEKGNQSEKRGEEKRIPSKGMYMRTYPERS